MARAPASSFGTARWSTVDVSGVDCVALGHALNLPTPVAAVLAGRGYTSRQTADDFLNPRLSALSDPFQLPGMRAAVECIWECIRSGRRMAVFGDFDADGVTSTALLLAVLRGLGADAQAFIPSRIDEGYGLTPAALQRCLHQHAPELLVTVDCGTCSTEAVAAAHEAQVEVVITDHHEPTGPPAPARAVVNPKLGERGHLDVLAGVGVAFKLCHGLVKHAMHEGWERAHAIDLRHWLDLVAVGTVADVVPLTGENRILVRHGIAALNADSTALLNRKSTAGCTCPNHKIGLAALMKIAGVRHPVDTYHIGFAIGPRINAAGRMGNAETALQLLLADSEEAAIPLARQLDDANRERKRVEDDILEQVTRDIEPSFDPQSDFGVVGAGPGWHVGTIGIVASRICKQYGRPAVVISLDKEGRGRGSGRSIEALDLLEAFRSCAEVLRGYGGHRMAAGLSIDASQVQAFTRRFAGYCAQQLSGADLRPAHIVDGWIDLADANESLLAGLESLRPFGIENPIPTWGVRHVRIVGQPRVVGSSHLKFTLAAGATQMQAIGFGMAGRAIPDGPIDVLAHLHQNVWRGRRSIEFSLKDLRASGPAQDA